MSREVRHDGRGTLRIRFSFDRRLVELVKTLPSRRWHAGERFWSAPEGDVQPVVELLLPEGFHFDRATRDLYRAGGGRLPLDGAGIAAAPDDGRQRGLFDAARDDDDAPGEAGATTGRGEEQLSVSALNEQVREALRGLFPAPVWLVGEISGFNKAAHKRHVGFQLVERDATGTVVSQVNATLFEGVRREIAQALGAAGDPFRLEDEVEVRVRVRVDLYVPWGAYRVVVEELDLRYTLGETARRREEIVRRLAEAGLLERNRSLPLPGVPLRVGLITSLRSDAFNDVIRTLHDSGCAFRVTAHGARVQGRSTEPSVLNALDWFRRNAERFDVLLLCRGGGSRTDLAWFDSEALGRAVAGCPLPVIVGIGHEQDRSVLDEVARSRKTPTAAAAMLVERVETFLEGAHSRMGRILELAVRRLGDERRSGLERTRRLCRAARGAIETRNGELTHAARGVSRSARGSVREARRELARRAQGIPRAASVGLGRERLRLQTAARRLAHGARRETAEETARLGRAAAGLAPAALRHRTRESERLDARERRLALADPRRVVERGYAILRDGRGTVITTPPAAPAGAALRGELRGGTLLLESRGPAAGSGREGDDG